MKEKAATGLLILAAGVAVVLVSWFAFGLIKGDGQGNGGPGTPPGATVPGRTTTGR